jgi:tetratricopeptide (TPR) repeat protein
VLYEMLSGRRAFARDSAAEAMAAVLKEEPPQLTEDGSGAELPIAVRRTVRRCLEKKADERIQSASDLAHDLRAIASASDGEAVAGPGPPARRRWMRAAVALAATVTAAGVLAWLFRGVERGPAAGAGAGIEAGRVVVAGFANRTGDPALESLGLLVADSITGSLYLIDGLEVALDPRGALGGGGARPEDGVAEGGPLRHLAAQTRAALVVAGSCYLRNDELVLQARVVDPWQGEVVQSFEPVAGPRADPSPAISALCQRVAGALAAHFDASFELGTARPVPLRAYQEYRQAMRVWVGDSAGCTARLERALEIDPDFSLARTMLVWRLAQREPDEARQHLAVLEARAAEMTPFERTGVRAARAHMDGDLHELVAVGRESLRLAPGVHWIAVDLGIHLLRVNRPHEALEVTEGVPDDWVAQDNDLAWWPLDTRAEALHVLGDYEAQLAVARHGRERFPDILSFAEHQVAALAALGRLDELESVVDGCLTVPAQRGSAVRVMKVAAQELRVHGHHGAGLAMAVRCVDWCRGHVDQLGRRAERELAGALYLAERWDEARGMYAQLAAGNPGDPWSLGILGATAARLGEDAEARRLSRALDEIEGVRPDWVPTFQRACIAAQLGDMDRAVDLLRQAFAEGMSFNLRLHRILDLEPLRGDARFQELVEPKG